jgi:hypothetical protein
LTIAIPLEVENFHLISPLIIHQKGNQTIDYWIEQVFIKVCGARHLIREKQFSIKFVIAEGRSLFQ